MKKRLTLGDDGILRDHAGNPFARIASLTLELLSPSQRGGSGGQAPSTGDQASLLPPEREDEKPAEEGGLGGAVAALFELWKEIFPDKSRALLSPARRRSAEKGLRESSDLDEWRRVMTGLRLHRERKPGSTEFSDVFRTFPGSGDLRSRMEFFIGVAAEQASAPATDDPKAAQLLDHVRATVQTGAERERGERAKAELISMGFRVNIDNGRVWVTREVDGGV